MFAGISWAISMWDLNTANTGPVLVRSNKARSVCCPGECNNPLVKVEHGRQVLLETSLFLAGQCLLLTWCWMSCVVSVQCPEVVGERVLWDYERCEGQNATCLWCQLLRKLCMEICVAVGLGPFTHPSVVDGGDWMVVVVWQELSI